MRGRISKEPYGLAEVVEALGRVGREVVLHLGEAAGLGRVDLVDRARARRLTILGLAVLVVAGEAVERQRADLGHGVLDSGAAEITERDRLLEDLADGLRLVVAEHEVDVGTLAGRVL